MAAAGYFFALAVLLLLGTYTLLYIGIRKPDDTKGVAFFESENYFWIVGGINLFAVILMSILAARLGTFAARAKMAARF